MSADRTPDEARVYRLPGTRKADDGTADGGRLVQPGDVIDGEVCSAAEEPAPPLVDQPAPVEDTSLYDAVRQARGP